MKSLVAGRVAEERFDFLIQEGGGSTIPVTKDYNIYNHIDRVVWLEDCMFTVDIKACKAQRRGESPCQDELWIELYNVRGKPGWLFGKADAIAFELRMYEFLIVRRIQLEHIVRRLVDLSTLVDNPLDAMYRTYQRKGRKDLLTKIRVEDVMQYKHMILGKKQ